MISFKVRRLKSGFFTFCYNKQFKSFGQNVKFFSPLKINGKKNIVVGSNVTIEYKSWLAALPLTGEEECLLEIGDDSAIGHFNHIFATKKIIIGKKVLTADKVYITDNLHSYENVNTPIIDQPIKQIGEVCIGDGSWLGENVCVLGSSIGKHCIIGANSVVTKNIPDYCVAVGIPAKIIKRYCFTEQKWRKTDENGKFID